MKVPVETQEPSFDDSGDGLDSDMQQQDDMGMDMGEPQGDESEEQNPFDSNFDAGIDVDEDEDPKKYIQKLTGKLAQKLRDYNSTESDSETNKFVINSLIPASVPNLSNDDIEDVIEKVKTNNEPSEGGSSEDDNIEDDFNAPMDDGENDPMQDEGMPSEEPQMEEGVDIDDLVNEILGSKKLSRNMKNRKPFNPKKFK